MTAKTKPAPGRKTKATIKPEEVGEDLSLQERLRLLYHGRSLMAHRFRYGLLALDIVIVLFIIGTSFIPRAPWIDSSTSFSV